MLLVEAPVRLPVIRLDKLPELLADAGYPGYGSLVLATAKMLAKPELVKRFVAASIEGWKKYLNGDPKPDPAMIVALEQCKHGNAAAGIATLEQRLRSADVTPPPR